MFLATHVLDKPLDLHHRPWTSDTSTGAPPPSPHTLPFLPSASSPLDPASHLCTTTGTLSLTPLPSRSPPSRGPQVMDVVLDTAAPRLHSAQPPTLTVSLLSSCSFTVSPLYGCAPQVMDVALRLHHACIRSVLLRHNGYESATEGDSFVLAFHGPVDAARFALTAQLQLMVSGATQAWSTHVHDSLCTTMQG